ncbi:universal stress protein [Pseudochryseolinea flava]|uniref:Universal stress protein n=1 Tax=Pseudochryseolinea flava TaxID=2059302 RepID=A0A364Y6E6_9BACT|nr:universal stress protein [Pseudochryseolinea flava]RAW02375.1 universal stress protein [Pseudochryseolinea flava]
MKKILVPCDFSKPAINAFRHALDFASKTKATVELLHVIELPILSDSVLMPVLNFEKQLLKELREKTEERFEKLITKYAVKNVRINRHVLFGTPALMISDTAIKSKADLILIGSHGASGIRELFIGSNAEKVVRKSTIPVIVIKDYKKLSVKNIVFANGLDESNQHDLIEKVKALQAHFKAKLHIVRINTIVNFKSDLDSLAELNTFVKTYGFKNFSINIFNALNEERGVIEFSKHIGADLIAMGTHGRKGLAHIFNESKTEDVVNHADLPIWTYAIKNIPVEA